MSYNALQLLYGIGRGIRGGIDRSQEYSRQAFLDDLQKQQVDLERSGQKQRGEIADREAGQRDKQFGLDQSKFDEAKREYEASQQDITGGEGITIPIGDQKLHLPGRLNVLDAMNPVFREMIQQQGETGRAGRELDFRLKHPEAFGGSKRPMTPDEWKAKLLLDITGQPSLGDQPGAVTNTFNEALALGQKNMPGLYGEPPEDPTVTFLKKALLDPRSETRDGRKAMVKDLMDMQPDLWAKVDKQTLQQWMNNGPREAVKYGPPAPQVNYTPAHPPLR
jgi:hypothetical protein